MFFYVCEFSIEFSIECACFTRFNWFKNVNARTKLMNCAYHRKRRSIQINNNIVNKNRRNKKKSFQKIGNLRCSHFRFRQTLNKNSGTQNAIRLQGEPNSKDFRHARIHMHKHIYTHENCLWHIHITIN